MTEDKINILAFDTSTRFLSVACVDARETKAVYHRDVGIRHSEILVPVIRDLLGQAGWSLSDVDLVCVGIGPGSFTGLRIGVATCKGLAAAGTLKVVGVPTMDAIVMRSPEDKGLRAPLLDARKNKVYTCVYGAGGIIPVRMTEYILTDLKEFLDGLKEKVVFLGDAVKIPEYRKILEGCPFTEIDDMTDWIPRAEDIGLLGRAKAVGGTDDPEGLDPMYLHAKECNITVKKGIRESGE